MFYSVFVLGKKGPLARVWLAAHWDKKITKAQILETNIVESVDSILQPRIKLSLRTSSHLLLGIVRIYARKTLYLLQDCQDAAFKIKSAFRPGVVDLPDGKTEAAISAITLPEMFDFINDIDLMPDPLLHLEPTTTANIRNITLAEDISSIHVDDPLLMNEVRDWSEIGSIGGGSINIKDTGDSMLNDSGISLKNNFDMFDRPALDDGFGGQIGSGIVDEDDVFGMPMPSQEEMGSMQKEEQLLSMGNGHIDLNDNAPNPISSRPNSAMSAASDSMSYDGGPPSIAASGPPFSPGSPAFPDDVDPFASTIDGTNDPSINNDKPNDQNLADTALSQNTMVLEPIDSQLGGLLQTRRKRRKKIGMVIDEVKTLSGEEMKAQLSDTSDIVTNLDLAPPNKMLMNWKKTGLSDKLFSLPERNIAAKVLFQFYSHNLITSRYDGNNENELNDEEALLLNHDVPDEEAEQPMYNGRMNHHQTLPELDDVEQHLSRLSPVHEMSAPRTPRAPKSPAPSRKRKKVEDKENKENTKRPRESRHEKSFNNHQLDHSEMYPHNESNLLQDISSIQDARAGSDIRGSSVIGNMNMEQPMFNETDEEKDDEDEDDIFDYGNGPMSVGPNEEMLPDETADQFEERMRTKRSNILLKHMGTQLEEAGHINFHNLVRNNKRKLVAQKFYALLVLKKQMAIELYQNPEMPYSELIVTKGLKYDEHVVSSVA